ncbi:MAG: hypothetical protein ABI766_01625 [Gemmatimonadales bacterium]
MLTKQPLVPELGPSLGRLTDPSAPGSRTPLGLTYDDIRLDLVTGIFELAGAARGFAASGDTEGAMASLGRVGWLGLWERAVGAAAARIGEAANSRLREAATESRFSARKLKELLLTSTDVRSISARLGSGGAPFVGALDALEQAVHSARANSRQDEWRAALEAAARRLESAWLAMVAAATIEEQQWRNEAERVRAWCRPMWPVWVVTTIVLAVAAYLGLVVGGYLAVPEPLRGLTEFWWSRF